MTPGAVAVHAACSYVSPATAYLTVPLLLGAVALAIGARFMPKRSRRVAGSILLVLAVVQIVAYAAVVAVFSRVELRVDDDRIAWAFGMGAFGESAERSVLENASGKVDVPHGLGLRIEDGYIAYWLGGTKGVRMRFRDGSNVEVSCTDPRAVLEALQRKR